jgi:hypothetical protein
MGTVETRQARAREEGLRDATGEIKEARASDRKQWASLELDTHAYALGPQPRLFCFRGLQGS